MDLGCGDGRICIQAALVYGATAIGVEIEADLITAFKAKVAHHQLQDKVSVVLGDLSELEWKNNVTVIITYLLPEAMVLLTDRLQNARKKGVRIVCNSWGIPGQTPTQSIDVGPTCNTSLYLYDAL